jgi:hypothetical protein
VMAVESRNIQPGTKTVCTSQNEKWMEWKKGMFPGVSTLENIVLLYRLKYVIFSRSCHWTIHTYYRHRQGENSQWTKHISNS